MNNDQRLTTLLSTTLMLATLALGWLKLSDRLSIPKIGVDRPASQAHASEQDVTARLWEDPLQAVQAEVSRDKDHHGHEPENLAAAIQRKFDQPRRVCLLVVPIPETPFPDDVETRLRLRYSVQMAMAQRGYAPEDRNHLGYVRLKWPGAEGVHARDWTSFVSLEASPREVDIPYEWFVPRGKSVTEIVLLWLPEGLLGGEPLCRLAHLRHRLIPEPEQANQFAGLLVIGPRSSDTLKRMVQADFPREYHLCPWLLAEKFCLFSPQATAPDALIGLTPTNILGAARQDMNVRLTRWISPGDKASWNYFENFIAPDDQLTDLLVQELAARRVCFNKGRDRVLLLAEADTSYGRSLPLAFQASVRSYLNGGIGTNASTTPTLLRPADPKGTNKTNRPIVPANESAGLARQDPQATGKTNRLIIARYLRGLDSQKGYQGREPAGTGDKPKSAEQMLTEALNRKSAPAIGDSQLDYVERLAGQLATELTRSEVRAVGVLGGDLYDKLVLLRTLRRQFPEALFFTTDLDARLWDPEHLKFTRNLVVASSHDLLSARGLADFGMPPFRDVYQATVFNACVAALDRAGEGAGAASPAPTPALYEIGWHGAVRLQSFAPSKVDTAAPGTTADTATGQGWLAPPTRWMVPLLFLCAVLAGALLLLRSRQRLSAGRRTVFAALFRAETGWLALFATGSVVGLSWFALQTQVMSRWPGGEPWSWSDGVSIWPTELVRLLTLCIVVWMLVCAWQSHERHCAHLLQRYDLSPLADAAGSKRMAWRQIWQRICAPWPAPERTASPVTTHWINAGAVFHTYLAKAGLGARCLRVTTGALLYFGFGMGVMVLGGTPLNMHIRGDVASTLDFIVLLGSVLGLVALVFWVLDAACLSARMLDCIARPFTVWPQLLLDKHAADLGVRDSDLEGYLDVQFAAENTRQVGRLLFLPFLIQFLMLVSRNSYFDNWRWRPGLVFIFVFNILLAAAAWAILRRAATHLRAAALEAAGRNLRLTECDAASHVGVTAKPPPAVRRAGLLEIKRRIEQERRGAYARWIQDPALLAMLIPTGFLGILSVLFQALFGFR